MAETEVFLVKLVFLLFVSMMVLRTGEGHV